MTMSRVAVTPIGPPLPEFECEPVDASSVGDVERPLGFVEKLFNNDAMRRLAILIALGLIWELYARWIDNPLILPTFGATVDAFVSDVMRGVLVDGIASSLRDLILGYAAGLLLATLLTTIAVSTRLGSDLLSTLTAMFNPVPAIALLPLALIWFGLGMPSLVFVIIHSVLWAVALNTLTGFRTVPETFRMGGRSCGLHAIQYVALLL